MNHFSHIAIKLFLCRLDHFSIEHNVSKSPVLSNMLRKEEIIYVGLQSAMGTLKYDGHAKVRWFALKYDGMARKSAIASPIRNKR